MNDSNQLVTIYVKELREKGFVCAADVIETLYSRMRLYEVRILELEEEVAHLEDVLADARKIE